MVATDSLKFHTSLDGLTEGEIYYLRAYAINDIDTYYGNEVQVKLNYFVDSRDGKVYKYTTIGNQTWMAENLAYLPEVCNVDEGCGFYVYGYEGADLQLAKATENYHEYGVLYNYLSASDACPVGWHLPS